MKLELHIDKYMHIKYDRNIRILPLLQFETAYQICKLVDVKRNIDVLVTYTGRIGCDSSAWKLCLTVYMCAYENLENCFLYAPSVCSCLNILVFVYREGNF